jgi:hypothetical protein
MFATSMPSTVAIPPLRSLDDLPTEILVEIISYHRSLGLLDFFSPLLPHGNIAQRRAQREVLRCLSQTCSVVRAVCLSFLWERFDLTDFDNGILKVVHRQAHSARFKFRALSLRSAFSRVDLPWLGTQFKAATIELQTARSQKELAKIIFPYIKYVRRWYLLGYISYTAPSPQMRKHFNVIMVRQPRGNDVPPCEIPASAAKPHHPADPRDSRAESAIPLLRLRGRIYAYRHYACSPRSASHNFPRIPQRHYAPVPHEPRAHAAGSEDALTPPPHSGRLVHLLAGEFLHFR